MIPSEVKHISIWKWRLDTLGITWVSCNNLTHTHENFVVIFVVPVYVKLESWANEGFSSVHPFFLLITHDCSSSKNVRQSESEEGDSWADQDTEDHEPGFEVVVERTTDVTRSIQTDYCNQEQLGPNNPVQQGIYHRSAIKNLEAIFIFRTNLLLFLKFE